MGDLAGPGCASYAAEVPSGPGSVEGMTADPVAAATSNNPLLKTLVRAMSGQLNPNVNLVDTLNGGQFTRFGRRRVRQDRRGDYRDVEDRHRPLTRILTYHVVPGQLAPDAVVGEHATVEKGTVNVTGSGHSLKGNDANVVCGGVKTANATVYLIDSVLMPTM